jgi:flagellar basal body-associated protein FliL
MGRASFICSITGFVSVFVFWLFELLYIADFTDFADVFVVVNLIFCVLSFLLSIIFGIIEIKKNDARKETAKIRIIYSSVGIASIIAVFLTLVVTVYYENKKWEDYNVFPYNPAAREYSYYDEIGQIITKTNDDEDYAVIVEMFLGYLSEDQDAQEELAAKRRILRNFCRTYFSTKSRTDLFPGNEDAIKREIRELINSQYLDKGEIKMVLFNRLDVTYNGD